MPGFDLRAALAATREGAAGQRRGRQLRQGTHPAPARRLCAGPVRRTSRSAGSARASPQCSPGVRFRELPKDAEALRRKLERDVGMLRRHTKQHAKEPRWHYYLGATHHDLGEYAAAIDAFKPCASLGGWTEEGAWACYRAAECCCTLERWKEAIDLCVRGARDPPGHRRARLARGLRGLQGEALRGRHRLVEHGDGQRPVRGCGRGFPARRLSPQLALYEGPTRCCG